MGLALGLIRALAWEPGYRATLIQSFHDKGTADLFNGNLTRLARKLLPVQLWIVARRRLEQLDSAGALGDLRVPPGNRLEALQAARRGQHSIRINDQFRICFEWTENGPADVEITDYH